jgi:hypothetical protein
VSRLQQVKFQQEIILACKKVFFASGSLRSLVVALFHRHNNQTNQLMISSHSATVVD